MERPAILNRSMPSTAGATMSNPANPWASVFRIPTIRHSLDEERNLHIWRKVYLMESGFSRYVRTSAHVGGQMLMWEGQTCSLRRAFTKREIRYDSCL